MRKLTDASLRIARIIVDPAQVPADLMDEAAALVKAKFPHAAAIVARAERTRNPKDLVTPGLNVTHETHVMLVALQIETAVKKLIAAAGDGPCTRVHGVELLDQAIELLWKRLAAEEYGHGKAAVALDIEALQALRDRVTQV